MSVRKKISVLLLSLIFIVNMFSVLNNLQYANLNVGKKTISDSQNILRSEGHDYNYWYNYTLHKLNDTGTLTGVLTPFQSKILENVTLTYVLREENYFTTPFYNRFEYWEAWIWDNLIPIYWGNITYNFFQSYASHCEKDSLMKVIQIYWALMINNLTIPVADELLYHLPIPEPDPFITVFNPQVSFDSKIEGSFQIYAPFGVFLYSLSYGIGTFQTRTSPPYPEVETNYYELEFYSYDWEWPGVTRNPTFTYSVESPGYIGTYEVRVWYVRWWYWGFHEAGHGFSDPVEVVNFTVDDDDQAAPLEKLSPITTGVIPKTYNGDYEFVIRFDDQSGWKGFIQLQYDCLDMSDSPIYEFDLGDHPLGEGTLTLKIPKNEGHPYDWGNWIDSTKTVVKYRYRAVDNDNDNSHLLSSYNPYYDWWMGTDPRGTDKSGTSWSDWEIAGTIWSEPGADIVTITQQIVANIADQWVWMASDIRDDGIYMNQPFTVNFQVTNPMPEVMNVKNGTITIESTDFISGNSLITSFWSSPQIIPGGISLSEPLNNILNYALFTTSSANLIITISFYYQIATALYSQMSITENYIICRPDEPTFAFKGFEGPKNSPTDDSFIYKTKNDELSTIWVVFKVENPARIPIRISQVLDFESTWYTLDQDPELGEGWWRLIDIQGDEDNPVITTVNPGESEIRVRLDVLSAIFFADLPSWSAALSILSGTIIGFSILNAITATQVVIEEYVFPYYKYAKPIQQSGALAALYKVISIIIATVESYLLATHFLLPKDVNRAYKFQSIIQWEYQVADGDNFIDHQDVGYSDNIIEDLPEILKLKPSMKQINQYEIGIVLRCLSIALTWTSIALGLTGILDWLGIIFAFSALATSIAASLLWMKANDPLVLDSNYNQTVEPTYRNITYPTPENNLENSIYEVSETVRYLEGDSEALNISLSRRAAAIEAGDNENIIKQDEAIYNYSSRVAQGYEKLGEDTVRFNTEYNNAVKEENITQIENYIQEGIHEDERGNLTQYGLNDTEIERLDNYTQFISQNHSISLLRSAFYNTSIIFNTYLTSFYASIQEESESYDQLAQEILNESIILKNTTQNKLITTTDSDTLEQLGLLTIQANDKLSENSWTAAIDLAKDLKKLALSTIEKTLNQTYFFYVEEANRIITIAEEKMKIAIIPMQEEIALKAGIPETMDLIILSTGAPSGSYKLLSNSSWVQPWIQDVDVVEWDSTMVSLTLQLIESFDVEPGKYPINLTLYLEGTDTKKTIIITVIIVSTKVENMMNYIFYEIADLRNEVDKRVCFLFDWMIIDQLDTSKCFLDDALEAYHDNATPKSVVLDKLAKANIELSDVITIILDWIGFISEADGDFISMYLHRIRDHITLTMGATVGTEEAMLVAQIETEIKQLADQIFTEYSLSISFSIDLKLWAASENLDLALIWMALGCGDIAEMHLLLSIHELACAKCVINSFTEEGRIPEDKADEYNLIIDEFIAGLEPLYTHYTHEGGCGWGDMHTHQGTEENNDLGNTDSTGTGSETVVPNTEMPTH